MNTFSEYILNETLKTHDIDLTISNVETELSLLNYNVSLSKNKNNTFTLKVINFNYIQNTELFLSKLTSLIINRHGWFPSKMKMVNISSMSNLIIYNQEYLLSNSSYISEVDITYESKFDNLVNNIGKLYHLSIQEYKSSIIKNGIVPKSKSKLSAHLDRIYVCETIDMCEALINDMRLNYSIKYHVDNRKRNKLNTKWIIYEIDSSSLKINIYKDPNYQGGYYIIDNIPPDKISVAKEE